MSVNFSENFTSVMDNLSQQKLQRACLIIVASVKLAAFRKIESNEQGRCFMLAYPSFMYLVV